MSSAGISQDTACLNLGIAGSGVLKLVYSLGRCHFEDVYMCIRVSSWSSPLPDPLPLNTEHAHRLLHLTHTYINKTSHTVWHTQ